MTIHQAFFGYNNGFTILAASLPFNDKILAVLKWETDVPVGVNPETAYLSGECFENYYVFTKTMPDKTAARAGTWFSHSLIIPLGAIAQIYHLESLFNYFVSEPVKESIQLFDIQLDTNGQINRPIPENYNALIDKLLKAKAPIIYIGYDDFESNIQHLWYHLPAMMRKTFAFTIVGRASDIQAKNYTIVHTPSHLRWDSDAIVTPKSRCDAHTQIHTYFTNAKDIDFQIFIEKNAIELRHFSDLNEVMTFYELIQKSTPLTFVELRRILIQIELRIPELQHGIELKAFYLNLFLQALEETDYKDLKKIRNMTFKSFGNGQQQVEKGMQAWVDKNVKITTTIDNGQLIYDIYFSKNPAWWNFILEKHLKLLFVRLDTSKAIWIWQLWQKQVGLMMKLNALIDDFNETLFVENIPYDLNLTGWKAATDFAKNKKWYTLHAYASAASVSILEAIKNQLKIDSSHQLFKNLSIIAEKDSKTFVTSAVLVENDILHQVAGGICADTPIYMEPLDLKNSNWQSVLYHAILEKKKKNVFLTNQEAQKEVFLTNQAVFFELLNLTIESKFVKPPLLKILADPFGNIFNYSARQAIWEFLNVDVKEIILSKTSLYIFEDYETLELNGLEAELKTYLKRDLFVSIVLKSTKSVKYKIRFLEKLEHLQESDLKKLLTNYSQNIDFSESDLIAKIIRKNHYIDLLNDIYFNHNKNIQNIVYACKDMLGWFKQICLGKPYFSMKQLCDMVDKGDLDVVYEHLGKLDLRDGNYFALRNEYIAGMSPNDEIKHAKRLKAYIQTLNLKK